MCSLEFVKCVCTSVKECDNICFVVVFVQKLEFYQQSCFDQKPHTQRRFRVQCYLNDLNIDRLQSEDANAIRYNREIFV